MFLFGIPFLVMLGYSLFSGRAYSLGWVQRDESPVRYWMAVSIYVRISAHRDRPFR